MKLDEAITHAEEMADRCSVTDGDLKCEMEHRQLAEWLRDYKRLLEEPETAELTTEAIQNVPVDDLISRKAAIDILNAEHEGYLTAEQERTLERVTIAISELPSAQCEKLSDKEQRIFLAAMERERKVCKQVDDEWRDCREPYEDSLVSVCNEIERKVKGALWTTV